MLALYGLFSVSGQALAVETDRWTVVAIGLVLGAVDEEPVQPPPELDPAALDPAQIVPTDPSDLTACSPYLVEFLSNTEYLGPLLDFVQCSSGGAVDTALDALAGSEGVIDSLRSYAEQLQGYVLGLPQNLPAMTTRTIYLCSIGSAATKLSYSHLLAEGDTRCMSIDSLPDPDGGVLLDGSLQVIDFLNGTERLNTATVSGNGVVAARGSLKNPTPGRLLKTKYHTNLVLPNQTCLQDSCRFAWAVIPNKNPNTGTSLPCNMPGGQLSSARLECEVDSRPYTQATLD